MGDEISQKPPTIVLHTCTDSPPGRAVQIVLAYLNIPYRIQTVDFDNGEHFSEEFLKMYPQGEIPVLDDDGLIIGESVAIIQYLAEKYGRTGKLSSNSTFYPADDPVQRSVIHHRLSFHLSVFQRRVYDYMILPMDYDYPRTEANRIKLTHALAIFDEFLRRQQEQQNLRENQEANSGNSAAGGQGFYVAGENFTIADPPLLMATCALVAMDMKILEPFRNIGKWLQHFQEEHPDLWTIAKEGLDGLSYYNKNPRDMSHLKHPIHPVRKGDGV
ncbi:unnamed protein product [Orchesella dallaii]|uniref:Glutathione S-transferase 1 n=1 Tax=Orchesella dallaii TaxID=48710 RepID=A0ABP1QIJ9_9HEXA